MFFFEYLHELYSNSPIHDIKYLCHHSLYKHNYIILCVPILPTMYNYTELNNMVHL